MLTDYQRLMTHWYRRPEAAASEAVRGSVGGTVDHEIARAFARTQRDLASDLIAHIHAQAPAFFEELVIDVLLAMGYGGRRRDLARRLGRSGDGGIDGLIAMDELGLDLIYLQAKRLKPGTVVPVTDVRDFAGSLDAHHAVKGIFVTTSHFSPAAAAFCRQVTRRVALLDGTGFAELMIRHNVGVRVKESYQIKRIDLDYFRKGPPAPGPALPFPTP
jgi:restriction system protein